MIGAMWQGDDFEWHGDLLEVQAPADRDRHVILPRPVQLPHPPLYLASEGPKTAGHPEQDREPQGDHDPRHVERDPIAQDRADLAQHLDVLKDAGDTAPSAVSIIPR